eukprot:XP_011683319.1 PREDICTED: uncharacterized protein LOC105447219 [Strongylocentrotus purpuratus]
MLTGLQKTKSFSARTNKFNMERTSGCRKWLILAGGFFVFFLQYGMIKSLGLLINDIIADLDVSTAFVGFCISMVSGVSLILSFITIPLLRRCPARLLIMVGGAVNGLSIVLASICPNGALFGFMLFLSGNMTFKKSHCIDQESLADTVRIGNNMVNTALLGKHKRKRICMYIL